MTKITMTLEFDSTNPIDTKVLAAIGQAFNLPVVTHPSGGPMPRPRAAKNDPQITKAEDISFLKPRSEAEAAIANAPVEALKAGNGGIATTTENAVDKALGFSPNDAAQKMADEITATKAVTPTIPKAVMPTIPKAVMPAAMQTPVAQVTAAVNAATANTAVASVTIKELRELMALKITTHVDALRNKLVEFGTANISSLKPEHYDEFHAYLNTLS